MRMDNPVETHKDIAQPRRDHRREIRHVGKLSNAIKQVHCFGSVTIFESSFYSALIVGNEGKVFRRHSYSNSFACAILEVSRLSDRGCHTSSLGWVC